MNKSVLLAVAIGVVAVIAGSTYSGSTWQRKSASEKHADLWGSITSTSTSGSWPSTLSLAGLFAESMNPSFDTVADEMPSQGFMGLFTRHKLIHSVGGIAPCKFVSNGNHPFTGLFTGAQSMFIRASTAKKPDDSDIHSYTPGIALKWLRTGKKSANFMAMYALDGQPSFDFFLNDLSTNVPNLPAGASLALLALKKKFETASKWPVMLGLSDVAKYDEAGNEVSEPVFPFRLHFESLHRGKMATNPDGTDLPTRLSQMTDLKAGTALYKVHAAPEPNSLNAPNGNLIYIGDIVLTGGFVPSKFADETLFFEHQRKEDDFKLAMAAGKDWEAGAKAQIDFQGQQEFHYPNLS